MNAYCFNPRPCVRGDWLPDDEAILPKEFQSTPLREGRHDKTVANASLVWFQSTPLREGRHCLAVERGKFNMFQSTPLREGRQYKNTGIVLFW